MFTRPTGRLLDPRADHDGWKALLKAAGVREARLHDARHTAAGPARRWHTGTNTCRTRCDSGSPTRWVGCSGARPPMSKAKETVCSRGGGPSLSNDR